jgi:hypothetical protein
LRISFSPAAEIENGAIPAPVSQGVGAFHDEIVSSADRFAENV